MDNFLLQAISRQLNIPLQSWKALSGGDISGAYLLQSHNESVFCKVHSGGHALEMFRAEEDGLSAIANTGAIKTPQVLWCGQIGSEAVLALEFIHSKRPSAGEMELFGQQLAAMHLQPQESFGWSSSNFIGSLPQSNNPSGSWSSFYLMERLMPQLAMARTNGFLLADEWPDTPLMEEALSRILPEGRPSLLHGDLWGGNFLIATNGTPCLIDPAVYRGHHEVDLAMSQLFGGFSPGFYRGYDLVNPRGEGYQERLGVYQLYYLLVHLNLFGASYLASVKKWLTHYFGR